jgi:membrane protein DedA with SNARE-associated domain
VRPVPGVEGRLLRPSDRFRLTACHNPLVSTPPRGGRARGFPTLPAEPPRRALPLLLVPIGLLVVASNLASVFYATLVERHPLWLLGLSSINRYLALVTPHTDVWSYFLVGGLRLLVADPFFYLLGYWYGDRALHALERRVPSVGVYYRQIERLFERARYPAVFLAPNNPICLFAGAARMNPVGFMVANVAGTIARLALIRAVGNVFGSPIRSFTGFLDDWKWPLLAVSAVILVLGVARDRRAGRTAIGGLLKVGEELSEAPPPTGRAAEGDAGEEGAGGPGSGERTGQAEHAGRSNRAGRSDAGPPDDVPVRLPGRWPDQAGGAAEGRRRPPRRRP